MDKVGTQTNGPKDKKVDDYAQGFSSKRWHEGKDSSALRIVLMHQLKDYIKKSKVRLITAAYNSIGNINTNRKTTKTRKKK